MESNFIKNQKLKRTSEWVQAFIYLLFLGISLGFVPSLVSAQLSERYFYKQETHSGIFNPGYPLTIAVNGGFDILRNGLTPRRISSIEYIQGRNNVNRNLANPMLAIRNGIKTGGSENWKAQLSPTGMDVQSASWVPNYQSHMIGEGFISRQLAEWYQYQGTPYPYFMAIANTFAYQYTNEVVENHDYQGTSVDAVFDIYLFNPMGYLIFSFDPVAKFFANTLHMANWSPLPMFNPGNKILANVGEEFIVKVDAPYSNKKIQVFYSWGIDGNFGLTYNGENNRNFSLGGGLIVDRLKAFYKNELRDVQASDVAPHFVFYYDVGNVLLLSLAQTGIQEPNYVMNLMPGCIPGSPMGFFLGYNRYYGFQLGVSWNALPLGIFAGT